MLEPFFAFSFSISSHSWDYPFPKDFAEAEQDPPAFFPRLVPEARAPEEREVLRPACVRLPQVSSVLGHATWSLAGATVQPIFLQTPAKDFGRDDSTVVEPLRGIRSFQFSVPSGRGRTGHSEWADSAEPEAGALPSR